MRRLMAALLLLCAVSAVDAQKATTLEIDPAVFQNLRTLAAGLHNEVMLCLRGEVRGDTVHIRSMQMRPHTVSTPDRSTAAHCPDSTLAWWHNHSRFRWDSNPLRPVLWLLPNPREFCYLSTTDQRSSLKRKLPFAVVSVTKDHHCWWHLDQIREADGPLYPPTGQVTWDDS